VDAVQDRSICEEPLGIAVKPDGVVGGGEVIAMTADVDLAVLAIELAFSVTDAGDGGTDGAL